MLSMPIASKDLCLSFWYMQRKASVPEHGALILRFFPPYSRKLLRSRFSNISEVLLGKIQGGAIVGRAAEGVGDVDRAERGWW